MITNCYLLDSLFRCETMMSDIPVKSGQTTSLVASSLRELFLFMNYIEHTHQAYFIKPLWDFSSWGWMWAVRRPEGAADADDDKWPRPAEHQASRRVVTQCDSRHLRRLGSPLHLCETGVFVALMRTQGAHCAVVEIQVRTCRGCVCASC